MGATGGVNSCSGTLGCGKLACHNATIISREQTSGGEGGGGGGGGDCSDEEKLEHIPCALLV